MTWAGLTMCVGFVLYLLPSSSKAPQLSPKITDIGRIMFWTGLAVVLLSTVLRGGRLF